MNEILGSIVTVEDDSYDNKAFKKVTLATGQVLKVKQGREGALKDKWGILSEGAAVKFTMTDFTKADGVKIPFVSDIEAVKDGLKPAVNPNETKIPQQDEADKALKEATAILKQPKPEPAPQAVGMMTKEIGDMIRAKYLTAIFGDEVQKELIRWYRSQTLGITRISFDESKLPKFE